MEEYVLERLCAKSELDLRKTFDCGQCFRWTLREDGSYTGAAADKAARLFYRGDEVYIELQNGTQDFWRVYFDLDTDYAAARRSVEITDYLKECAEYGAGIRILRQDKWEALCSFIFSQCNNIPRIRGIIEKFCLKFGEEIGTPWGTMYAFPEAELVARLNLDELAELKSGYRAPYVLAAAEKVAAGELDLDAISRLPADEARAALKALQGVGDKVANCAVLFGLHKMDAFPIDVWMRRALREHMSVDFDPKSLGEYAGLAQQYMFFSEREKANSGQKD